MNPSTTSDTECKIEAGRWQENQAHLQLIRTQVFIEEQHVPAEDEWDSEDETATHFIIKLKGRPIGCARLLDNGHIGRFAILAPYRTKGYGYLLLAKTVGHAFCHGHTMVFLHAQHSAINFYLKYGFEITSDTFMDAGIPHKSMQLDLKSLTDAAFHNLQKLLKDSVIRFDSVDTAATWLPLVSQASTRDLRIFSTDLQRPLYATEPFLSAVSHLARQHRAASIKILIQNPTSVRGSRHPLVELAQRLPSKMEIRITTQDVEETDIGFVTAGARSIVFFNNESTYTGFVNQSAPAEVKQHNEYFDTLWHRLSKNDPNLRRFTL